MKKLSLLLFLFVGLVTVSMAQRTVSGKVTDQSGLALIGANVLVPNTSAGTITDVDGNFSLSVPQGSNSLEISYTGFENQIVDITGQSYVDVQLAEGQLLDEIVVTGTGVATDRRRTAISVETVSSDELIPAVSGSVDQALVGKIPGAYIQQSSGQPGQQANIILRGINSLGGTTPMILVDGVQISTDNLVNGSDRNFSSRLADIDFNNVERVEVVQGAAAATIYGAQGANGVIQIFTKKGKKGKPRITFSQNYGISNPILGDFGYADLHAYQTNDAGDILVGPDAILSTDDAGIWGAPLLESGVDATTSKSYTIPTFNLLDQIFQDNVANARTSINVSGGSDNVNYSITGTYNHQESAIFGRNNRINIGTRFGIKLADNLDANFGISYINGDNNTGVITGTDNVESALGQAATTFTFIDFTNRVNGNLVANPAGDNSVNPLYTQENRLRTVLVNRILPNFNLTYRPFSFMELDYKFGYDYYRDDFQDFINNQTAILAGTNQGGIDPFIGRIDQRLRQGELLNQLVSSRLTFGSDDKLLSNTLLTFDYRSNDFSFTRAQGTGLPFYEPVTLRAASQQFIDEFQSTFVTYGFLVNEKLEWQGKLGLSAGVRVDWSSAFGQGSDPFVFPRADVYARLSEFDFWSGLKNTLPEFKFRAAYGQAGIQPGAFDRIITLNAGQLGSAGFLSPQIELSNPELGVQVSKEFEFGFDAGLSVNPGGSFLPYIGIGFTYWDRTSEDVIRLIGVAPTTGSSSILDNAVTLASNGIQLSLTKDIISTNKFDWRWTTNFGTQTTILESISNNIDIPVDDNFILVPGQELGTFRGQRVLTSIDQTNDDGERYISEDQASNYVVVPETGFVVDTRNNSPVLSPEVTTIGNGMPDFNMSFIHDFTFGQNLSFGFQLDWVQGFDIYNQTRQWGYRDNLHADVDNPITVGDKNGAFLNYYRGLYNTNQANSAFVEDGSFVRLRNVRLAYDFADLIGNKNFRSLELNVTGFNLFTLTDYTGFDPEAASDLNDPTRIGLDEYAFPNTRGWTFGVNVGF